MKPSSAILILLAGLCAASAQAATRIDLGAARDYSGFFFGDASRVMDVEGRLAVGGSLQTSGFSIGYRAPYGSSAASLVVGGDVKLGTGAIFGPPKTNIDTNASTGPITSWEKPLGYGVYGGKNQSLSVHDLRQGKPLDFAAAHGKLTQLSSDLSKLAANGVVEQKWGGLYLSGDGQAHTQVFNLHTNQLSNLYLQNVRSDAQVVVNVFGAPGNYTFAGGQDGQLEALRDRVLFNFVNASDVKISTFTWGSILATGANISGTGHIEGSVMAHSINAQVEIGYEPWHTPSAVPEAHTWAMLLGGLGLLGWAARRRRA
ncbi:choice-of-anchor A family protein [Massilia sp. W12]|uniref:choice-of-anchor A family protein n=1 Tax=Massilia sp. W12 TaxID=3126507 RepID=UPI0030D1C65C